jgi:dihydrofolate reductase
MRRVITGAFVSLDGVMQAPGAPEEDPTGGFRFGGWVAPYVDDVFGQEVDELFSAPYDLLLGRKTYEIFAAHWPYQGDDEPIAKSFNAVTKYVATRSDRALPWKHAIPLHDATTDVARLKRENGPNLVTQGSSDLIQTLLAHDLIDEFKVFTFPLLLGRGKRLFGETTKPGALTLVDNKVTTAQVTISSYRRAGAVITGDLATNPPSEAELERRAEMKREARNSH